MTTELNTQAREVAWIAGVGASAGLGAALARRFAEGGFRVAVTGRSPERLAAIVEEIRAAGGEALALPGDVSDEHAVAALALRIAELGVLRVGIFNAASGTRAPTLELSADQFEQAWRTSTLGGFVFGKQVLVSLLANGGGTLLFTGATASLRGRPPFAAFAAAKAALRSLSQSFAREFGPQGVHVAHVIIDGGIDGERLRLASPQRVAERGADGLLDPAAIAEAYWQVHKQPRSAWSQEIDLRPYNETF
ncbi:SDR family NAD(P)-dependent oxidoreductase [Burkholderia sp. L27(2015)]|uniref:SDR family NAD(P)-dependent oxidoreductase n=1 Tax=Burkholderia sp. L27(2015) TaxID=1641858 RepID=UPI00131B6B16|nr:SDR family NAD(P)-dependent oxidoreductase [Burkholderia sp. L27(2015)]